MAGLIRYPENLTNKEITENKKCDFLRTEFFSNHLKSINRYAVHYGQALPTMFQPQLRIKTRLEINFSKPSGTWSAVKKITV